MQIVGLDIGGSKTHAVSRTQNGTVEVFAGSANLPPSERWRPVASSTRSSPTRCARSDRGGMRRCGGGRHPESEERLRQLIAARPRRRGPGRP